MCICQKHYSSPPISTAHPFFLPRPSFPPSLSLSETTSCPTAPQIFRITSFPRTPKAQHWCKLNSNVKCFWYSILKFTYNWAMFLNQTWECLKYQSINSGKKPKVMERRINYCKTSYTTEVGYKMSAERRDWARPSQLPFIFWNG